MSPRIVRSSFIYLLILVGIVALFFTVFNPGSNSGGDKSITDVVKLANDGKIDAIEQDGQNLKIILKNPGPNEASTYKSRLGPNTDIEELLATEKVDYVAKNIKVSHKGASSWGGIVSILFTYLPIIILGFLFFFMIRQAQGTNNQALSFGRSRARMFVGNKSTVTFADVAGVDEAKIELQEIVEFLKYPEKFAALGARIPKGVLLVGPPGTGKTLLSRAVAGEAGVPFFSISGSEFVEMFVGVGASRVRDLFDQAKRNVPCIVFIDEIDAVGRHRGAGMGGGHDEREQTLNQILVEMDGFDTTTNIIVLAATNRPDILDPALLRPGRFDRRVVLDQPDINGRKAILTIHIKGKPLDEGVNMETIAKQTPGFSGADLANLVNEAAILAARRSKKAITMPEMEEAIDRVVAGPERKSRLISPKEKEITAYHEAGHALVAFHLPHADPVHKISIIARGMVGGYTRLIPTEDRYLYSKSQFEDMLATSLGGRTAELLTFSEVTTGASNDLEHATKLARKMVTEFGMSSNGVSYVEAPISQIVEKAQAGEIESIEVYGNDLLVKQKDRRMVRSRKEQDWSLVEFLEVQKIKTGVNGVQVYVKDAIGLGDLGLRTFGNRQELIFLGREISEQRDYGDKVAESIDEEIKRLIRRAEERATAILKEHKAKLAQIAKTLITKESLDGKELEDLFKAPVVEETGATPAAAPA